MWCDHSSVDHERALACYHAGFGWSAGPLHQVAPGLSYQEVAMGGARFGGFSNAALRPEVHPHWVYYFPVEDLAAAAARVRAAGGDVGPIRVTADGAHLAYGHDPQGAALSLKQHAGA